MKQSLYMLLAITICVCLMPVLLVKAIWQQVWDALDTAMIAWTECGKVEP
jgi:hypothetical protein